MKMIARFREHTVFLLAAFLLAGLLCSGCTTTLVDSDHDGVPDATDRCPFTPLNVPVTPDGCMVDSDHDGVADVADRCPDTLPNIPVTADGCAADNDHDGVTDDLDRCPNTPPNVPVTAKGCTADRDDDGIYDNNDQCPDTPKGTVVDTAGCPLVKPAEEPFVLQLEFLPNQAELLPACDETLKKAAEFIALHPDQSFWIDGYTDSVGADDANVELSIRRAEAVRFYLSEKYGIAANRLVARGFGEKKPIADNGTQDGRKQNRRVEILPVKSF